jgi:apolipoprotein N-acyltransferase
MTSVATPDQDAKTVVTTGLSGRSSQYPLVAGLASGLLLWTSFPPAEWSWLAWIALAPLFWLVTLRHDRLRSYLGAWAGGFVFWLLAVSWVRLCDSGAWMGWILMACVLSMWWPGFLALCRWAVLRLEIPLIIAAPIIWVGLEYFRAYFFSGFPWYYLGHSQFRFLFVIQIADLAGSLGVSLLIAIVNVFIVDVLTLPLLSRTKAGARLTARQNIRLCLVTILLGTTLCYGAFRVSTAEFHDGPKFALLQSNIEQSHKNFGDPFKNLADLEKLVERALSRTERPDLIVWPETSYPFGFITVNSAVDAKSLESQVRSISKKILVSDWLDKQKDVTEHLHRWTDRIKVPMLVGTGLYDHQPTILNHYNSAILFEPSLRTFSFYHKMHLVPFGEYIPFVQSLPWLTFLTPYRGEKPPSLSFGTEPRSLVLGPYRLAVTICFEDTIPQVIGRFFHAVQDGHQPDVLINLSNDGWFHDSAELDMHLASAVFRTVEHRVPLVRAVNTGLSAMVDGNGEIRAVLPKEIDDVLSVTIPLDDRTSFYSRWGDWLGLSCIAITIGLIPIGIIRKPRKVKKRPSHDS